MTAHDVSIAVYRLRVSFGRRWPGYVAVALMVALVGGLGLGALTMARRTQSSFPAFLRSTNPSDLSVVTEFEPDLLAHIAALPGVTSAKTVGVPNVLPMSASGGAAAEPPQASDIIIIGSVDGLLFEQDRLTATKGRLADPSRADEVVVTPEAAQILSLHVGDTVKLGMFTNDQASQPDYQSGTLTPVDTQVVTIVGIAVFNDAVVQDDTERSPTYVVLTPALMSRLTKCCVGLAFVGLQLDEGTRAVNGVVDELENALPAGGAFYLRESSTTQAKAERAIRPESIALAVFGLIALLAAIVIAAQLITRELRDQATEFGALRALGASRAATGLGGVLGIIGAVFAGAVLAGALGAVLSMFAPIGPVRAVDPHAGITVDWTVTGLGIALLVVSLSVMATGMCIREMRATGHPGEARSRTGNRSVTQLAARSSLPISVVAAVDFAFGRGGRREASSVRAAILGGSLATIVLAATLTFGASLHNLVVHPALYGWNWNAELDSFAGGGFIPQQQADTLLGADPDVASWSGAYFDSLRVDGETVPMMGMQPNSALSPPILQGHAFQAADQIVLGAITLAELHKHIGDTVQASYGTVKTTTTLHIVGVATLPAVGPGLGLHLSMGIGAIVSEDFIPADTRAPSNGPPGPNAIFVRFHAGLNPSMAMTRMQDIASTLSNTGNGPALLFAVQRPAEIVNYRAMGSTPTYLGAALALGAVTAFGLALLASVRRRRRDLALLKTLGFTQRQVIATIAWQSTIAVACGLAIGTPIGIMLGRWLWDTFSDSLHVVTVSTIPTASIALIIIGGLVLANLLAAVPARYAARTSIAGVLRAD